MEIIVKNKKRRDLELQKLNVLNDIEHKVEVIFDKELIGKENVGVHPNDNTATVWLHFDDIKRIVEENGNTIKYIEIK